MANTAVTAVLLLGEAVLLTVTVYLLLLVLAGAALTRKPPPPARRKRRFAVVVPAHDEQGVIARNLASLNDLDYPRTLFDIHVIADNCDDHTAAIARTYTSFVHERTDRSSMGKGQALRWLFDRLSDQSYDAFAIIDADSLVSRDFLSTMNDRLESGCLAVQGHYAVLNAEESWVSALRAVAFCLLHSARRKGLSALGASAGLGGNGMVFAADLRQAREWDAFGVTEDLELHSKLVAAGVRVAFAPEALVLGEMPTTLAAARGQNLRWERGRLALARHHAPKLVVGALRSRDWPELAAALDLLIPPLSVVAFLTMLLLTLSLALGSAIATVLPAVTLLGLVVYVVAGLASARAPLRLWLALGCAPLYILWKGWLYMQALAARKAPSWTRTRRIGEVSQGK